MDQLDDIYKDLLEAQALLSKLSVDQSNLLGNLPKKIARFNARYDRLRKAENNLKEDDVEDYIERYEEAVEYLKADSFTQEIKNLIGMQQSSEMMETSAASQMDIDEHSATSTGMCKRHNGIQPNPCDSKQPRLATQDEQKGASAQGTAQLGNGPMSPLPAYTPAASPTASNTSPGVLIKSSFQDTQIQNGLTAINKQYIDLTTALDMTQQKSDVKDINRLMKKIKQLKVKYDKEAPAWNNSQSGNIENLERLRDAYMEALEDFEIDSFSSAARDYIITSSKPQLDSIKKRYTDLQQAGKHIESLPTSDVITKISRQVQRLMAMYDRYRTQWAGTQVPDESKLTDLIEAYDNIIDVFEKDSFSEELKFKLQEADKNKDDIAETRKPNSRIQAQYEDLTQAFSLLKLLNIEPTTKEKIEDLYNMYEKSKGDWDNLTPNTTVVTLLNGYYEDKLKSFGHDCPDFTSVIKGGNSNDSVEKATTQESSESDDGDDGDDDICKKKDVKSSPRIFIYNKNLDKKTKRLRDQVLKYFDDICTAEGLLLRYLGDSNERSVQRLKNKVSKAKDKFLTEGEKRPSEEILVKLRQKYENLLDDFQLENLTDGVKSMLKEHLKPLLDKMNTCFMDLCDAKTKIEELETTCNTEALNSLKKIPTKVKKLLQEFIEEQNSWDDDIPPSELTLNKLIESYMNSVDALDHDTFCEEIIQRAERVVPPCSEPGKPTINRTSNTQVRVIWDESNILKPEAQINNYMVQSKLEGANWVHQLRTKTANETFADLEVIPNSTYKFRVYADCGTAGMSKPSPESDKTIIPEDPTASIKQKLRNSSGVLKNGSPNILELLLRADITLDKERIKKCHLEVGRSVRGRTEKVIMIVGATGSGKTTLINGMVNYIFGVNWRDDYRFKLISEDVAGKVTNQAHSQTSWITSYTIHYSDGMNIPYTLTIVDTPGFGDTRGIMRDKEITNQISRFFSTKGNAGIDHIDAIGFVAQAGLPRLTPTQKYVFDSILGLFGKDIAENIFLLLTFADGQIPPALSGIEASGMPYQGYFKFNSSALFALNTEEDSLTSSGGKKFDHLFWKMGMSSYCNFFSALNTVKSKTLILTKDVLHERAQLETFILGIQVEIQQGLNKMEQLQTEAQILKNHQADIDKNKSFNYTVDEETVVLAPISPGSFTTNCLKCKRTCHYPCAFKDDKDKARCTAMDGEGNCAVCPAKCRWDGHKNLPHKYEIQREKVTKCSDDLKKRYEESKGKKLTAEQIITKVVDEIEGVKLNTAALITQVRKSVAKLDEIALKPNPLSTAEYIDLLIQSEESEANPGWKERVRQLHQVKEQAEFMAQLSADGFDPFAKYREKFEEEKKKKKPGIWTTVSKYFKPNFWTK